MAADLAAAIKRCKLSPEAGAAELRKALEETDELASAAARLSTVDVPPITPSMRACNRVGGQPANFAAAPDWLVEL